MGRPRSRGPRGRRQPIRQEPRVRINERIRVPQIRVIDVDGEMVGIMSPQAALKIARERGLDLVEIAPQASPPVCKIIDFGKYRYEQQKREKAQKKSQHQQQLKEIRFKLGVDTHDFDFKTRHAREFLEEGNKVKATVFFRGREIVHKDLGKAVIERFISALADISKVDQPIKMEGPNCSVIVAPDKTKIKKKPKPEKEAGSGNTKPAPAPAEPIDDVEGDDAE